MKLFLKAGKVGHRHPLGFHGEGFHAACAEQLPELVVEALPQDDSAALRNPACPLDIAEINEKNRIGAGYQQRPVGGGHFGIVSAVNRRDNQRRISFLRKIALKKLNG